LELHSIYPKKLINEDRHTKDLPNLTSEGLEYHPLRFINLGGLIMKENLWGWKNPKD
tara:strand:- start:765 stop:935 length:171 start_codon:yes stop_codon:yes gene_type:complete